MLTSLREALRRGPTEPDERHEQTPDESELALDDEDEAVVCAFCGHVVARLADRRHVDGRHTHSFRNPAGFRFVIVCFAEAAGCATVGPAIHEHTWFAGFAWRVAVCGACGEHLGWRFEGEGQMHFFGLVRDHIATRPS